MCATAIADKLDMESAFGASRDPPRDSPTAFQQPGTGEGRPGVGTVDLSHTGMCCGDGVNSATPSNGGSLLMHILIYTRQWQLLTHM